MNVIDLTAEFVSYNTVSNLSNAKCSAAMAKRMREAGLSVERLQYADPNGVTKVCLVGKKGKGKGKQQRALRAGVSVYFFGVPFTTTAGYLLGHPY